jgi:hypothetical protein
MEPGGNEVTGADIFKKGESSEWEHYKAPGCAGRKESPEEGRYRG